MVQMIEHSDPPEDVFRAIVENAAMSQEDLANKLCCDEVLAHVSIEETTNQFAYLRLNSAYHTYIGDLQEYAELLRRDIEGRLQDDQGQ